MAFALKPRFHKRALIEVLPSLAMVVPTAIASRYNIGWTRRNTHNAGCSSWHRGFREGWLNVTWLRFATWLAFASTAQLEPHTHRTTSIILANPLRNCFADAKLFFWQAQGQSKGPTCIDPSRSARYFLPIHTMPGMETHSIGQCKKAKDFLSAHHFQTDVFFTHCVVWRGRHLQAGYFSSSVVRFNWQCLIPLDDTGRPRHTWATEVYRLA